MGCRGVKNVWSAKFFSCPSGNSEIQTARHTITHTYTHVHTNAHQKRYSCHVRHRHFVTSIPRKTHVQDRVHTHHKKKSRSDHRTHIHRGTLRAHKTYTFPNSCILMNTATKGRKLSCLRTHTRQKINVPTQCRTCKHTQKCLQGKCHTL